MRISKTAVFNAIWMPVLPNGSRIFDCISFRTDISFSESFSEFVISKEEDPGL